MTRNRHRGRLCALLCWLVPAVFFASCKPAIPSEYIQPSEMEDMLYDYHLSMAMVSRDGYTAVREKAFKLAVMKKYGVSEEKFDRSLQYYMRHTEKLHDIYVDLTKRLENEARAQGASESELAQYGDITSKGDTTDIWHGSRSLVLSPYAPVDRETFEIKADTAYHKGDRLLLSFDSQFLIQDGMRDAVVVLAVTYSNDSINTQYQHISSDSHQTMTIDSGDSLRIKDIRGYFLMLRGQQPTTTFKMLVLSNIHLVRMHIRRGEGVQNADSLQNPDPIRTIGGEPVNPQAIPEQPAAPPARTPEDAMRERGIPERNRP
ncbi:MAG: DUF4296 domain-containing protein [Prevotella multiformis]|uniref:DUF4296 domain-containing protein n=1 Tax=Prevotella multiformis TaxID=282402 RepID=UPI003FA0F58F